MKYIFILILFLSFGIESFSQENMVPIKYGTSVDDILSDSVFIKFLTNSDINIFDYTIVSISDITEYTSCLRSKKNSYRVNNLKYTYTNISNFQTEKSFVYRIYENSRLKNEKKLMCWRSLSPDENNKFTVFFYYVF